MNTVICLLYWLSSVVVLAEALNKLERTTPFATGMVARDRLIDGLKALAWSLLALGSAGALVGPLMFSMGVCEEWVQKLCQPGMHDAATMVGFALLIVRTRVKEG